MNVLGRPLLVVRLRGTVNVRDPVEKTLKLLHLTKRYRATMIPDTPSFRGMLKVIQNQVAWCEVDSPLVEELIRKRGRTRRLGKDQGVDVGEMAVSISAGRKRLEDHGLKPTFALSPPRGGFKASSRRLYSQGGVLGKNSELPELVRKML